MKFLVLILFTLPLFELSSGFSNFVLQSSSSSCNFLKRNHCRWRFQSTTQGTPTNNLDITKVIESLDMKANMLHHFQKVRGEEQEIFVTSSMIELRKAAEQGDMNAQVKLANMVFIGNEAKNNEETEVKKEGSSDIAMMINLNSSLLTSENKIEKDEVEAAMWYRKAAEQGSPIAQAYLGLIYRYGLGVEKDEKEAIQWYRKSAEQGICVAQLGLALMLYQGHGVDKNENEALIWFRKAALQANVHAQLILGILLSDDKIDDKKEAEIWYRKAAEQGNPQAQETLGLILYHGYGVKKNKQEAGKWFLRASEQGQHIAQLNFGKMLRDGVGLQKNGQAGAMWLRKASLQRKRIELTEIMLKEKAEADALTITGSSGPPGQ